jgi:mono/diheme cytochrome c family protein
MLKITMSFIICVCIGLLVFVTSSANEKGQHKKPHGHGHWSAPPEAVKRANPVPRDQASIARGKNLFTTYCSVCHGPEGRGDAPAAAGLNPKPPNLVKMAGHHPDGDIAWKIENGKGAMPAWKGKLEEKEIWDLTNFIKALPLEVHSH